MIWNILAASFLLWLSRRYQKQLKPGALFSAWLIAAGFWRMWLEIFFRPDQPKINGTEISYSAIVSGLMVVVGAVMLMVRYKVIHLKFAENWEDEYRRSSPVARVAEKPVAEAAEESEAVEEVKPVKKAVSTGRESTLRKKAREKIAERKAAKKSS
jgi:hypothetical protein